MTWHAFQNMDTDPADRHLLSALTRTAPVRGVGRVLISNDSFRDLREGRIVDATFTEKRDALLNWIAFESRRRGPKSPYGARVPLDSARDYPVAYCHDLRDGNADEWNFVFQPLRERGLIETPEPGCVRITDKGWEQVEARTKASGAQGFIAMAFKDMDHVQAAIEAGIANAGYRPLRIDRDEFVGGVMDQIIARIRESRFVVADFTHNRGGVYYEAGFAFGLGIPVIPTCRMDHVGNSASADHRVHFDVQHLNLLPWTADSLASLSERLEARIVSLFDRGPRPHPTLASSLERS